MIESLLTFFSLLFGSFIILYMLVVIFIYSVMLIISFFNIRKRYQLDQEGIDEENLDATYMKPISIIVPAYNEEVGILDTIYSLMSLRFPQTEVIVVNDGSKDGTQDKLIQAFQMKKVKKVVKKVLDTEPIIAIYQSSLNQNVWLVEKENGGKADALNAGINVAKYPFFCSIDGDSILNEKSLLQVMNPIVTSNEEVIAVGGNVRIANENNVQLGSISSPKLPRHYLVVMQVIEYLRAFMIGRISLSKFNMVLIISGAFSVFSKKWVIDAGGYSKNMIGEDMELVVKLHRYVKEHKLKKRIEFVADPVCWTEAPQTLSVLRRQRRRWQQGLLESLWKHKRMTLNPKYGAVGMVSFPYFWFVEAIGPLVEFGGYVYIVVAFFLGDIYLEFAFLLLCLFVLYGSVISIASVLLDAWNNDVYLRNKDLARLMVMSLTEVVWYKPLTLIWKLEGYLAFILRRKEWGTMKRTGLSEKGSSS
ncbi:glycosyltransferase family 2 protein [Pontibacillus litoralis]|uniref:Glycosyl transferase n=1 Tax=Pontibacillus litoralis JSM 072002 TaxID=1385512 RepID=A0A0A5FYU8_9BACI|nr:glycosyltransferase [Pontibacillus litoralis]KGX84979.1 glycosyl transferase [Pontibacillus litoralis JSM 072002]